MQCAVVRGLERRDDTGLYPDLDVDEIAYRKRHDQVTVISDPRTDLKIAFDRFHIAQHLGNAVDYPRTAMN